MTRPVVFDGGILGAGPITGVGRAFLHALRAYVARGGARPVLLIPPGVAVPDIPDLEVLPTRAVAGAVARRVALPLLLRRLRARVFHAPIAALPSFAPCPTIATVHDLPWRSVEPLDEAGAGWRARVVTRFALRHAAVVVVPSRATRDDVRSFCPAARATVEVVAHGVPFPTSPAPEPRDGALLVLADDRPRKNLDRLQRAHAHARALCADLPPLERLGPGARYVSEDDKRAAIRAASALVLVSLHEGFGLPVVEAFGHGTPVLCSDRKSLPEVAGDAALLVDPTDESAIAAALIRIHSDLELRRTLIGRGRIRAECFTPERTAAHWAAIHHRLAG